MTRAQFLRSVVEITSNQIKPITDGQNAGIA